MLTLKYRPNKFDDIVGNSLSVQLLKKISNYENLSKLPSGVILHGSYGTGKTSLARILGKALLCKTKDEGGNPCNECEGCVSVDEGNSFSYFEEDAASNSKVENIMEILEESQYKPLDGSPLKVIVLDECHYLSKQAQTKMLKTLEEGSDHCFFILVTTDISKIIDTIKSRLFNIHFDVVPKGEITQRLEYICDQENITYDLEVLESITLKCRGHVRDAVMSLQRFSLEGGALKSNNSDYKKDKTLEKKVLKILFLLKDSLDKALEEYDCLLEVFSFNEIKDCFTRMTSNIIAYSVAPNTKELDLKDACDKVYKKLGDYIHNCFHLLIKQDPKDAMSLKCTLVVLGTFLKGTFSYSFDDHAKEGSSNLDSKLGKRKVGRKKQNKQLESDMITPYEFGSIIRAEVIED